MFASVDFRVNDGIAGATFRVNRGARFVTKKDERAKRSSDTGDV